MVTKQGCKRVMASARSASGHRFTYQCPVRKADQKREGKTLVIGHGHQSIALNGNQLNMLKRILIDCGEFSMINNRRSKMVIGP